MALEAWIDGACEPINPGGMASYGVIVKSNGVIIFKKSGAVGRGSKMSNNVGEYSALIALVEWYKSNNITESITVYSDSQLVVNQMCGIWGVHKGLYIPYYEKLTDMLDVKTFDKLKFFWIPREQNWEADKLSKDIFISHGITLTERE